MRLSRLLTAARNFRLGLSEPARREALRKIFGDDFKWHAANQCTVSDAGRFIYNRIPKNANSSLVTLMHAIENGYFRSVIKSRRNIDHLNTIAVGSVHRLTDYRRMVVVRNPYSRLLSAFLEKMSYDRNRGRYGKFELSPDGFDDFIGWLERGGLEKNQHWDLQTRKMILPLGQYTDVIRFEALHEQLGEFIVSVGLGAKSALLENMSEASSAGRRHGTGASGKIDRFYTQPRAARVYDLYRSDFEALGYGSDLRRLDG